MNLEERKRMIVGAIRRLENKLCSLKHCEYDGMKSLEERDAEIDILQQHLRTAHTVLVILNEQELEGVA